MTKVALYVAKFINEAPRPHDSSTPCVNVVLRHFESMAELKEWVEYHNFVLGIPRPGTAFFSVEHGDGSILTEEELLRIEEFASVEQYKERIRQASGFFRHGRGPIGEPDAGERHYLLGKKVE